MADKLGVTKGDRVALVLTNLPEFAFFCAAAAKLGAVPVPFNYMLKADELSFAIEDCKAKVLVTERDLFEMNIKDKAKLPAIEHWIQVGRKGKVGEGFINVDDLTEGCRDKREAAIHEPPTTPPASSTPRAPPASPRGPCSRRAASPYLSAAPCACCVSALRTCASPYLPLAHIFGFVTQLMGGIVSGASGYLMRFFDPVKTLQNMEKYRGTLFIGVPAMYNFMLACGMKDYDLSSMRLVDQRLRCHAGRSDQADRVHLRALHRGVRDGGDGLAHLRQPALHPQAGLHRHPLPGIRVRIIDEDGKKLPRDQVGEIAVKGPSVMQGYWNNEEANRHIFVDGGWMRTGDIGRRDRLGYIYFMDREKDVIKCGGYSIFSREVEEKILEHPKVLECALVGAPHPEKKEVPVAFVQLNAGESCHPGGAHGVV